MKTGDLKHRITIQVLNISENENGFKIETWSYYKKLWSSANNLFGKEFWSAKAVQSERTIEFVVRYRNDVALLDTKKHRILWNNMIFNITFIDNIKYENKWLKIKAIEV